MELPAQGKGKRGRDHRPDDHQSRQPKRSKYSSSVCDGCKYRKVKCNGNTPCYRCGKFKLECKYNGIYHGDDQKESEKFAEMTAKIASLEEKLDNLSTVVSSLRPAEEFMAVERQYRADSALLSSISNGTPGIEPNSTPKQPRYSGPTSSAFNLGVAKNTLHTMAHVGIGEVPDYAVTNNPTPSGSPLLQPTRTTLQPIRDPLWSVTKEEAVRLCRVYEDKTGTMYPVLDIEAVISHANALYTLHESTATNDAASSFYPGGVFVVRDEDLRNLKMVIACASAVEGNGQTEIGARLYDSVKGSVDEILQAISCDIVNLPLLVLASLFLFHTDREALAWRMIGQTARACIELGLHRRDVVLKIIAREEDRLSVIRIFWSVYVLDHRFSFGTGMPFVLQDIDIDQVLPEPKISETAYLKVMVTFSQIGTKVWHLMTWHDSSNSRLKKEELGYLDYQILQWQRNLPSELQLTWDSLQQTTSQSLHRLQIVLYLRANQMRIHVYRPVLHSASSIMENISHAEIVVEIAKDTIRALIRLNQTTDIYRVQQVSFNYFLISAVAVIFLASCHAPVHFSSSCGEEFYMALDLVKSLSSRSYVSKRLWQTVRGLKDVGPNLGLSESMEASGNDDQRSAAELGVSGLASGNVPNMGGYVISGPQYSDMGMVSGSPVDVFQMTTDMASMFEAALWHNQ